MANQFIRILAALLFPACAVNAAAVKKENGFVGHYGYLIGYPKSYSSQPSFSGPAEIVQFMPATPCTADQGACAKAGWINLSVLPKWYIKQSNGTGSFAQFVDAVLDESKANGEQPTAVRGKLGGLPVQHVTLGAPRGPFNRMTFIEGKKVYYRFGYDSGNRAIQHMLKGLVEVKPNDTPPRDID